MLDHSLSPFRTRKSGVQVGRQARGDFTRWSALKALGPGIYAMRIDGGVIKIGFTSDLADRERSVRYQAGSESGEVLAFVHGTYEDEQQIHADIKPHLAHGREYYHPTPEVLAVVNQMRDHFGLPHIAA